MNEILWGYCGIVTFGISTVKCVFLWGIRTAKSQLYVVFEQHIFIKVRYFNSSFSINRGIRKVVSQRYVNSHYLIIRGIWTVIFICNWYSNSDIITIVARQWRWCDKIVSEQPKTRKTELSEVFQKGEIDEVFEKRLLGTWTGKSAWKWVFRKWVWNHF